MVDTFNGSVPLRWPLPDEFVSSPEVAYRNLFAETLSRRGVDEIIDRFVYLDSRQMQRLVEVGCRAVAAPELRGVGVELGAGCGLLSSTVARLKGVEKVIAVEVCEEAVRKLIPKVSKGLLGSSHTKVIPVIGSFDDIRLDPETVDFIVEIDSLHHSHDLARTFRECFRVLKPGGLIVCFDRCHPDTLTDLEVQEMLEEVYSEHFLAANHYPPGIRLTRRQNGEHEYRLFEWRRGFEAAGLRLRRARSLAKEIPFRKAVKGMVSLAPAALRRRVYRTENASPRMAWEWATQGLRRPMTQFGRAILAPKNTTVFLLEKPF